MNDVVKREREKPLLHTQEDANIYKHIIHTTLYIIKTRKRELKIEGRKKED